MAKGSIRVDAGWILLEIHSASLKGKRTFNADFIREKTDLDNPQIYNAVKYLESSKLVNAKWFAGNSIANPKFFIHEITAIGVKEIEKGCSYKSEYGAEANLKEGAKVFFKAKLKDSIL